MKQFGFGGIDLVRCLLLRYEETGLVGCDHIRTGSGTWTRFFVKINGETHYLWRAVDHEGEVLESYVTKRRDRKAALKFLRKAMKRYGGTTSSCDGQTTFLWRCNESCWQRGSAGNGSLGK
jgi:hypothetical protein